MLKSLFKTPTLARLIFYPVTVLIGFYILSPGVFSGQYNDFDISTGALVPKSEIHHGGPPRDGIPSIDKPLFIPAAEVNFLSGNDRVIGLITQSGPKAYPIRILNWHEIINDGDVVVSYCPLCGTGMAFKSPGANFGVSGLLYNSDMLLYDRETESLWSQIMGQAISGKRKGESLKMLVADNTSWENWQYRYPATHVLSDKTGFSRDYRRSPYGSYASNESLYFPVSTKSPRFHPKEKVIGLELNGHYKAYAFIELDKSGGKIIRDKIAGRDIEVHFNSQHRSGFIRLNSGETLPSLTSYWFAWYAFHPETEIYTAEN
ncbi:MAG: hypothetical protein DIZ80_15575 [endosymbiont of Galathealinum brachiosum]|uniref:DUF3179 domain-containing protein n=1 Tax=endosymbiont of Galathealinum brachiosum TaxID=2200906 RepID=A0A370D9C5_9GAMM|nr:MAG: hypothetical protein DIZ80_15575 [endosymbiont of Galathealinum brachiosum]